MRRQDIKLRALARSGDIAARLEIGRRYLLGFDGISKSVSTGIDYLNHPSVRDLPRALVLIAENLPLKDLLSFGQQKALEKAAVAGSASAQLKFGAYLLTHTGKEAEAASYFSRAMTSEACAASALAICKAVDHSEVLPKVLLLLSTGKREDGCGIAEFAAHEARASGDLPRLLRCVHAAAVLATQPTIKISKLAVELVQMAESSDELLQGLPVEFIQASLETQIELGSSYATFTLGRALSGIPCGATPPSRLSATSNLRKGAALLLRAADSGCEAAWLHLYTLSADHRCSVANPQLARYFLEKAAECGNMEAQRKLGALVLRDARSIVESEKAIDWLSRSAFQGDFFAKQLLKSLVLPVSGSASEANVALEALNHSDPMLAMRLRLSRHFGLTKLEALAVDPVKGERPWGLVVGPITFIEQIRLAAPRAIPALNEVALTDLKRAVTLFGRPWQHGYDPEGDLRRRKRSQRLAFERHSLDERMFFASVKSAELSPFRGGTKWAFRNRDALQLALVG